LGALAAFAGGQSFTERDWRNQEYARSNVFAFSGACQSITPKLAPAALARLADLQQGFAGEAR
jgi:hypothetical protein